MKPGATLGKEGVEYAVWAPEVSRIVVDILPGGEGTSGSRLIPMTRTGGGYHRAVNEAGRAGDAYGFLLEGRTLRPDPASRAQQNGVHGRSLVVDPRAYSWRDAAWERPALRDLSIYELHIGAFTPEGTFRAAIDRLPAVAELGVTALEIMPIADFPGGRNWGYDGVLIYAPAQAYGSPDDLRALVDAAHGHGLAVILDVVYNHFGPDGNYLASYSPHYFCKKHHTPWGDGFNFDTEMCAPVREFFIENPLYWMEEFHIDGFRFDATHEIRDDSPAHILAEMTAAIHARGGLVIAEDARNDCRVISLEGLGFDAVWADDFHHVARVSQTGERFSYFQDFAGTTAEVVKALQDGWIYQGQVSRLTGKPRGTACATLPPERFVHSLSNHDQTGNRALGERLHHLIPARAYRALSMLLCLTPYTPMFFMGQEWAASTPFLFFTDHHDELGHAVTRGRLKEFASFPEFQSLKIPDPQAGESFRASKLDWAERTENEHGKILALYRACLALRREHAEFRPTGRDSWSAALTLSGAGCLDWGKWRLLFNLQGARSVPLEDGELILSSEETRFGGGGRAAWNAAAGGVNFDGPEALLFRTTRAT